MFWISPLALFALAATAAPILIHILIQRRAERFPFPTLRFLQPTRLAAIRRHVLEDPALLAVRAAILAAAALALAGPLLVTASRRQAWDRRVVRAIVADGDPSAAAVVPDRDAGRPTVMMQRQFEGQSLADGIRRAVFWLETTPPGRREIVIVSPLPIGSLTQADISAVPNEIGVRFERNATLPSARTGAGGRLLTSERVRAREVTLTGDRTSFRDEDADVVPVWPIDVVSPAKDRRAVEAAIAAVRSRDVWAAPPDRRARLVVVAPADRGRDAGQTDSTREASPIQRPWMAQAIARMTRDPDLRAAGRHAPAGLADRRFTGSPWQTLTVASDGRPLAVAAGSSDRLLVASAADASSLATPVLLRAIANAIAPVPDLQHAEVMPIADAMLQQWSRPPGAVVSPRIDTVERDDRRWLWLSVACLLALETWMRRVRSGAAAEQRAGEHARVA
jgi:aerotolerance regulator-like protein